MPYLSNIHDNDSNLNLFIALVVIVAVFYLVDTNACNCNSIIENFLNNVTENKRQIPYIEEPKPIEKIIGSSFGQMGGDDGSNVPVGTTNTTVGSAIENELDTGVSLDNETLTELINNNNEGNKVEDLLPKEDQEKDWWSTDIHAKHDETYEHMVGIDTVGQSLKNSCQDIRGTVPCPKINGISPWGISSIEPDYNINGLSNC